MKGNRIVAFRILSGLGVVLSAILVDHDVRVIHDLLDGPSACNVGALFNCDAVAASAYSRVLGIPVACFGLVYYFALFCFSLFAPRDEAEKEQKTFSVFLFWATLSLVPTFILFYLSAFVVKAFCIYCSLLYLTNIALFFSAWFALRGVRTFAEAFRLGAIQTFNFLRMAGPFAAHSPDRRLAQLSLVLFVVLFLGALLLPGAIVEYAQGQRKSKNRLQRPEVSSALNAWRTAKPANFPLQTDADAFDRDFVYGRLDAPMTIIEFADFECPWCKRAAVPVKKVVEKLSPHVRLIFLNYPLDSSCNPAISSAKHPFACQAAAILRCAGLGGAEYYWNMHARLFEIETLSAEALFHVAENGIRSTPEFQRCLAGPEVQERIREEALRAQPTGIRGTPYFLILAGGKMIGIPQANMLEPVLQAIGKDLGLDMPGDH